MILAHLRQAMWMWSRFSLLVVVPLAVDLHQVEFVNQTVRLQQLQAFCTPCCDRRWRLPSVPCAGAGPHPGVWWLSPLPAEWRGAVGSCRFRGWRNGIAAGPFVALVLHGIDPQFRRHGPRVPGRQD